jgi:hypothetical protein
MVSRSLAWTVVTVVGLTTVACGLIATSRVPNVAGTLNHPPAALGATIEVSNENGTKAAYTVANFRAVTAAEYTQVKGTLYAIDITIQGISGAVPVNPMCFSASTQDRTHLDSKLDPSTTNSMPAICHKGNT